jgi:hypothetical protein
MHRSGTSVLSGLLNLSGINLGKDLMEGTIDNKKGYFENNKIVNFNVKLLNHLNTTWNDIKTLDETLLLKIRNDQNLIKEAKKIILDEFENSVNIGIKDPRICLLYVFWEQVLHELNFEINTVIIYRDPLEVAHSLNKRDNLDLNYSILLWFKHFIYAERMSRNSENRIIISYNSLIESPIQEIKFILDKFNIKNDCNEFALSHFIDKSLRNSTKNVIKDISLPNYIHQFILLCLEMKNNQNIFTKIFLLDKIFIEYYLNNSFYLNNTLDKVYREKALKSYKRNRLYRRLKRFFLQNND